VHLDISVLGVEQSAASLERTMVGEGGRRRPCSLRNLYSSPRIFVPDAANIDFPYDKSDLLRYVSLWGCIAQARSLRSAVGDEDQPPPVPAAGPVLQEDPAPARSAGDLRVTSDVGRFTIDLGSPRVLGETKVGLLPTTGPGPRPTVSMSPARSTTSSTWDRLRRRARRASTPMPGTARRDLHVKRHDGGSRLVLCSEPARHAGSWGPLAAHRSS
jgi:hypothetical protein